MVLSILFGHSYLRFIMAAAGLDNTFHHTSEVKTCNACDAFTLQAKNCIINYFASTTTSKSPRELAFHYHEFVNNVVDTSIRKHTIFFVSRTFFNIVVRVKTKTSSLEGKMRVFPLTPAFFASFLSQAPRQCTPLAVHRGAEVCTASGALRHPCVARCAHCCNHCQLPRTS
jgi:hypothetical protein